MWSATTLAPSFRALKADVAAQLPPVRGIERSQLRADWHRYAVLGSSSPPESAPEGIGIGKRKLYATISSCDSGEFNLSARRGAGAFSPRCDVVRLGWRLSGAARGTLVRRGQRVEPISQGTASRSLPKGAGDPKSANAPKGAVQSRTDFGVPGYGGPCPPEGDPPHHYQFTIFAVDVPKLDGDENTTAALVGFMLHFHTLAKATLTGVWGR